jgi:hypothetical protein
VDGDLDLDYDVRRTRLTGFAGPVPIGREQGVVRVALASGRVDVRPGATPPAQPVSEPFARPAGARFVSVHARAADALPVMGGPPPQVEGALVAGDRRLAFEMSPDGMTVTAHRWTLAGGLRDDSPLRLEHGRTTDAVWVTLDRHHVLLRRAHEQSRCDLYSLDTGAALGSLEKPVDVAVIGRRVFWTTLTGAGDIALTATDSGRDLWRRIVLRPDRRVTEPIP